MVPPDAGMPSPRRTRLERVAGVRLKKPESLSQRSDCEVE
jgi:hypothetical protein